MLLIEIVLVTFFSTKLIRRGGLQGDAGSIHRFFL